MLTDIIIGGLLLPLRIYFQPNTFRDDVNSVSPRLIANYTLLEALGNVQDTQVRRGLLRLGMQYIISMVWIPVVGYLSLWLIPHAETDQVFVSSSLLFLGIALGCGVCLQRSMALGLAIGVAFNFFAIATSISGAILSSISYSSNMEVALVVDNGLASVPNGIIYGLMIGNFVAILIGVLGWMRRGMLIGTLAGLGMAVLFWNGPRPEVVLGNVLACIFFLFGLTHFWLFPIQLALSLFIWAAVLIQPTLSPLLWHLSPVRWDEFVFWPVPGLSRLLAALMATNPDLARSVERWLAARPILGNRRIQRSHSFTQSGDNPLSLHSLRVFNVGLNKDDTTNRPTTFNSLVVLGLFTLVGGLVLGAAYFGLTWLASILFLPQALILQPQML